MGIILDDVGAYQDDPHGEVSPALPPGSGATSSHLVPASREIRPASANQLVKDLHLYFSDVSISCSSCIKFA